MNVFLSRQFLAFLCTGGIAATVNFGSRIIYNQWMAFSPSIGAAYITGMITAFVLAKIFVFKNSTLAIHKSAIFFILVNLIALAQTWLISMFLAYYALPYIGVESFRNEISHAIGVIVPVFSSYIGHRYWSFK